MPPRPIFPWLRNTTNIFPIISGTTASLSSDPVFGSGKSEQGGGRFALDGRHPSKSCDRRPSTTSKPHTRTVVVATRTQAPPWLALPAATATQVLCASSRLQLLFRVPCLCHSADEQCTCSSDVLLRLAIVHVRSASFILALCMLCVVCCVFFVLCFLIGWVSCPPVDFHGHLGQAISPSLWSTRRLVGTAELDLWWVGLEEPTTPAVLWDARTVSVFSPILLLVPLVLLPISCPVALWAR